jgi:hypothetical protein
MADASLGPALIAAASAIIGTIIGGVITFTVQRMERRADRKNDKRILATAVRAELAAYIELVSRRDHATAFRGLIASLRGGQDIPLSFISRTALPIEKIFPVFFSQIDKIGLLGDAISELAKFYTCLGGIFAWRKKSLSGTRRLRLGGRRSANWIAY